MPTLWLPIKEKTTQREQLVMIPGAGHIDKSQLDEIIAAEKEKTEAQLKALGPKPIARFSRKEVGQVLREFIMYLKRQREGTGNKRYY